MRKLVQSGDTRKSGYSQHKKKKKEKTSCAAYIGDCPSFTSSHALSSSAIPPFQHFDSASLYPFFFSLVTGNWLGLLDEDFFFIVVVAQHELTG